MLRKNYCGVVKTQWFVSLGQPENRVQDAQKGQTSHPPNPGAQDAPFRGQGRSERRREEVHTSLRVGRSHLEWILANGKTPSVTPTFEPTFPRLSF